MSPETGPTILARGRTETARRAWNLFLDLFYPPRCGGCDRRGTLLCPACRASIARPHNPSLLAPGLLLTTAGEFSGPLREAIHKLKFEGDTPLAGPLAGLLGQALREAFPEGLADGTLLVPVPLYSSRQKARGFNQSELLAAELSREMGYPVSLCLVRVRDTGTQVGRTAEQRRDSVAGAFKWTADSSPGSVLLIDDVCTTGSTLVACSLALRQAGAVSVNAATVAKAVFDGNLADPNDTR